MTSKKVIDVKPAAETVSSEAPASEARPKETTRAEQAEAAKAKAAQLMSERKFKEARTAIEEAEALSGEPSEAEVKTAERLAKAEAARVQAAEFLSEGKFAEAKKSLAEAEELESEPGRLKAVPHLVFSKIRSAMPKRSKEAKPAEAPAPPPAELSPVDRSTELVGFYSKIAAVAGVLPGGLLNFAAIFAVQVTMVWRISRTFGHTETSDKVRGTVLSLVGSVLPTGIGHGTAYAVASIPAVIAGTAVYFVATPVLAYAFTKAVGNAFIMHFESGGTLLTFDPKAFGEYFAKEFQNAGAVPEAAAEPIAAAV